MPGKVEIGRVAMIILSYSGPCTHPAIEKRSDGNWYCTECGQRR